MLTFVMIAPFVSPLPEVFPVCRSLFRWPLAEAGRPSMCDSCRRVPSRDEKGPGGHDAEADLVDEVVEVHLHEKGREEQQHGGLAEAGRPSMCDSCRRVPSRGRTQPV